MTKKEAIHFLYQIADEIQSFNIYLYPDMFGKTVFLTCAEAEAAIEARKGDKK